MACEHDWQRKQWLPVHLSPNNKTFNDTWQSTTGPDAFWHCWLNHGSPKHNVISCLGGLHINFGYFDRYISIFTQLTHWKLNVYFIELQKEKLKALNCEYSEKYLVQIWLISLECFVVNLTEVCYLVSYFNTIGQIYQNLLKSHLNSPGREKMTALNVQESLF